MGVLTWCRARQLAPRSTAQRCRAAPAADAGHPPVQALDRLPAAVRGRRRLPDLRHRRGRGTSASRHVRRPTVPPESPALGLTHLPFEAMLTAARISPSPFDFALVLLRGLLGLRIFRTVCADIDDLGEEHGRRVLPVQSKGAHAASQLRHRHAVRRRPQETSTGTRTASSRPVASGSDGPHRARAIARTKPGPLRAPGGHRNGVAPQSWP